MKVIGHPGITGTDIDEYLDTNKEVINHLFDQVDDTELMDRCSTKDEYTEQASVLVAGALWNFNTDINLPFVIPPEDSNKYETFDNFWRSIVVHRTLEGLVKKGLVKYDTVSKKYSLTQ